MYGRRSRSRPDAGESRGVAGIISTYDLTVPFAVAARDGFEDGQFAPLEPAPLKRDDQRVNRYREERERGKYNILDEEALRELRGEDGQGGRGHQHDEERDEQDASDARTVQTLAELDAHGELKREPVAEEREERRRVDERERGEEERPRSQVAEDESADEDSRRHEHERDERDRRVLRDEYQTPAHGRQHKRAHPRAVVAKQVGRDGRDEREDVEH